MTKPETPIDDGIEQRAIPPEVLAWLHDTDYENLSPMQMLQLDLGQETAEEMPTTDETGGFELG